MMKIQFPNLWENFETKNERNGQTFRRIKRQMNRKTNWQNERVNCAYKLRLKWRWK